MSTLHRAALTLLAIGLLGSTACKTTKSAPARTKAPVETRVAPDPDDSVAQATQTARITRRAAHNTAAATSDAVARAEARRGTAMTQAKATPVDPLDVLAQPPEERGPRDLVLVAVGDVSQPTTQWPEATNALKAKAFGPTKHLLETGDLVAMNLENPVSKLSPSAEKTYAFTAAPERLGWYFDVGFNLFSLSNNHIADADQPGIDDTLGHLQRERDTRDVPAWWAGAATSPEDAEAATIIEPPGKDVRIAFFSTGFSGSPNVSKFWSESLIARIRAIDSEVDVVIVSVHAGKEYQHVPKPELQQRYRDWVDAGADLVIGHHPHVIRPVEVHGTGLILHSLGNYVFASRTIRHRKYDAKMYGLITRVVIQDGRVAAVELTPTYVNNSEDWVLDDGQRLPNANFVPVPVTGDFADVFFDDFTRWSEDAGATVPMRAGDVGLIRVPENADDEVPTS